MPGPWEADAPTYFGENAEAIAAFDRYMTEKQQPYVTQLEESTKDARELWKELNDDPDGALAELVGSVYVNHPEVVEAYNAIFNPPAPEPVVEPPAVTPPADEIPEWAKPLVESHQQKVDREAREAAEAEYVTAKSDLKAAHTELTDEDLELIDPFVYGANGDMEKAYQGYKAWQAKAGIKPPEPTPTPTPPPVLGDTTAAATPPLATQFTKYEQVGDAFRAYQARQAAASDPPPIVG